MKKRKNNTNYWLLWLFFALGYFFGFCLVGIFLYPIIKFDQKYLEDAMKTGMVSGFIVCIVLIILLST